MSDCINAEVRDALPDLIHGRLSDLDKATMNAHVETCADCREEMRLLREVIAAAPIAPRIDVAKIVASLPRPMPCAADQLVTRQVPARRTGMMWKMTAAAALLITGSLTFATTRQHASVSPVQSVAVLEQKPSSTTSAPNVPAVESPVASAVTGTVDTPSRALPQSHAALSLAAVQDLSDEQLSALTNDLENVEALPAAEPEVMAISVDNNEGIQ